METNDLVERFARAMFDEWPLHAISPALAEQSGQPIGTPLTWEKVLEMGGNHDGLLRLAQGAAKMHSAETEALQARVAVLEEAANNALAHRYGDWPAILRAALSPAHQEGRQ